jgi:protocatechuate 3,4-dioxygenase beta subunit
MNHSGFLSNIIKQGSEKMRFQRVPSLLDSKPSNHIKASRWVTIAGVVAIMGHLIFGTVRLDAKPKESIRPPGWPKGNCSISGKVVSVETSEPVGHAKVMLDGDSRDYPFFIEVANDGTFMFRDIPAGLYSLTTFRTTGFEDVSYNPEKKPGKYPKFSLRDKEQRTGVVLRIKPACRIEGKILDENGEPLRGRTLHVEAWVELAEPIGQKRYSIAEDSRIASDGSYLLDGLDGRPVYVMAIDKRSQEKDEYSPPCYYPGTVDRNKAKKVTFDGTKSVENVDICLQKKGEFVLEGVVTDEKTGNPIPKAWVIIHHRDMLTDYVTTYTDQQGH